jgi:uncharacterized phage infection (PIP) family protein YhgE
MFRRFRIRKKAEEKYMSAEKIGDRIDKLRGKIPSFVLKDLSSSLEGKSITREQFDKILEEVTKEVEQSRIDKKIEGMAEQLTKLSKGVETFEKLTSEKPIAEFPIDKIEKIKTRVNELSSGLDKSISSSRDFETDLTNRLNEIERGILSEEVPMEKLERLERGVGDLSSGIDDLSKDMSTILGGIDISELIAAGLKRKLA